MNILSPYKKNWQLRITHSNLIASRVNNLNKILLLDMLTSQIRGKLARVSVA